MRNVYRAAHRSAEFVPDEWGFGHTGEILKKISGVQINVAMEFVERAVEPIRSTANDDVHDTAGVLTAIGARVRADSHLLNRVQRQAGCGRRRIPALIDGRKVRRRIGIRNAVDIKTVRPGPGAVNGVLRESKIAVLGHSGKNQRQSSVVAVPDRKGFHLLFGKLAARFVRLCLDKRGR